MNKNLCDVISFRPKSQTIPQTQDYVRSNKFVLIVPTSLFVQCFYFIFQYFRLVRDSVSSLKWFFDELQFLSRQQATKKFFSSSLTPAAQCLLLPFCQANLIFASKSGVCSSGAPYGGKIQSAALLANFILA